MTQIDDILELVRTGVIIPETNVAILAREVERLRPLVICAEERMYMQSLERFARKHGPESIQDVIGCLDHLRRNQP